MLDPKVREVLDGTPTAHLATVLPDGSPHVVPLWIGTHGDHVMFFTGPGARKARNIERDPRVAISTTPPDDPYTPVLVRGRVVEVRDGEAGWALVDEIARKYTGADYPRDPERVAFLVEPEHQTVGLG